DLLNTSTRTVTTNSMVVKSSLWSSTRHRRGLSVRVFFWVTTAVSPPSRGFRLGILSGIVRDAAPFSSPRRRPYVRSVRFPARAPSARSARDVLGCEDQGRAGAGAQGRGPEVPPEERRAGQALRARARGALAGRGKLRRGRRPGQRARRRAAGRRRGHRPG